MFKRILAAVDGSKTSLKALDKAIELQKLIPDAEIYILCVYKHHSLFEASLSIGRPDDMDIPDKVLSEYAKGVVNHAKELAKSMAPQGTRFRQSRPALEGDCEICPGQGGRPDCSGHQGHQQRQGWHLSGQRLAPGCLPGQVPVLVV